MDICGGVQLLLDKETKQGDDGKDVIYYSHIYDITECVYRRVKRYNKVTFTPDTDRYQIMIDLVLASPKKADLTLYSWYVNREVKSGILKINLTSNDLKVEIAKYKDLNFNDAYCYEICEDYSTQNSVTTSVNINESMGVRTTSANTTLAKRMRIKLIASNVTIE